MQTVYLIQSDAFPSFNCEVEGVNHDCGDHSVFGKRLAEWLHDGLTAKGWDITDCFAEDWGWTVELKHPGRFPFFVGCSNVDAGPDDPPGQYFRIFTEPETPQFRRWFRKHDISDQLGRLTRDLSAMIEADPRIALIANQDDW
ncbi:MAG: hypothetical protein Alpg2KO_29110 [Alphaproteobacteria bacterium]